MDQKSISLEDYLNRVIAREDGIRPDQVTVEYIHEMRKRSEGKVLSQGDRQVLAQQVLLTGPTSCRG
jgi:hypothetical protein